MKKKLMLIAISCILLINTAIISQAAEWKQDNTGWWYQNDDGSYPINEWKWIDKNNDGLEESYYFDRNGYLSMNISIDGYQVNSEGAWIVDNIVQTQSINLLNDKKEFSIPMFTDANPELVSREIPLDDYAYAYDMSGYQSRNISSVMASYSIYMKKLGYVVDIDNAEVDHTGIYVPILKDGNIVGAILEGMDNGEWFIMITSA